MNRSWKRRLRVARSAAYSTSGRAGYARVHFRFDRGLCEDVMRTVLVEHELVVGELVLREVDRVPRHKPGVNPDVAALVIAMRSHHEVVPVSRDLPSIELMDHDDLPVPASALDGEVDVIVTGDRALVDLGAVEGIRIRSPRAFWAVLSR